MLAGEEMPSQRHQGRGPIQSICATYPMRHRREQGFATGLLQASHHLGRPLKTDSGNTARLGVL
jgi:hypothetical protein